MNKDKLSKYDGSLSFSFDQKIKLSIILKTILYFFSLYTFYVSIETYSFTSQNLCLLYLQRLAWSLTKSKSSYDLTHVTRSHGIVIWTFVLYVMTMTEWFVDIVFSFVDFVTAYIKEFMPLWFVSKSKCRTQIYFYTLLLLYKDYIK